MDKSVPFQATPQGPPPIRPHLLSAPSAMKSLRDESTDDRSTHDSSPSKGPSSTYKSLGKILDQSHNTMYSPSYSLQMPSSAPNNTCFKMHLCLFLKMLTVENLISEYNKRKLAYK